MPNVRHLNKEKYKMSKQRFREIYYFCLQYNEWREELKQNTNTVGAICSDGLPHGSNTSDSTGELAIRRAELRFKMDMERYTNNVSKITGKMTRGEIVDLATVTEYNKVAERYSRR